MDKIAQYRSVIKKILQEQAHYKPAHGDIEPMVVFDETHDHYQLLLLGWDLPRRVHSIIIHIRIHNGKVWLEHDGTDARIARQLVAAGIPKKDIVLAFHPPDKRPYTDFAVA
ncbi:MAG: XisI protein [Chloroflexi bacterium AL-W]|nr:XisI protein [Chloroflexi bacterium AL-N1]NOK66207.1 XisI protein [Chloroflexi bacterium AL-N10]NOK73088.1 XisI protein [Chloroflexi bacterium AL-N5]NOK79985.1 XisI protein [Chloroflexi bacterium AL-W]NOK88159.1 XisI protein [Chloroflexi bacterium AL-N15]